MYRYVHAFEKKYSLEQQQQIINEYLAGATLAELGQRYGCTAPSVLTFLRKKGIKTFGRGERIRGRYSERQARIKQALLNKIITNTPFSLIQLAGEIGLSEVCVRGHLRDLIRKNEIDKDKLLKLHIGVRKFAVPQAQQTQETQTAGAGVNVNNGNEGMQ